MKFYLQLILFVYIYAILGLFNLTYAAVSTPILLTEGAILQMKVIYGDDGNIYIAYSEAYDLDDYQINPVGTKIYKSDINLLKIIDLSSKSKTLPETVATNVYHSSKLPYLSHIGLAASRTGNIAISYQNYLGYQYAYDVFVIHKDSESSTWDDPIRSSESPSNSGWFPNLLFDTNDDTQLTTMWFLYAGYFPVFYQNFFKKDFLAFPQNRGFHMYLKRGIADNLWVVYQVRTEDGDKIKLQRQENGIWIEEEKEDIPTTGISALPLGLSVNLETLLVPFLIWEEDHYELNIYQRDYQNSFIQQRKILSLQPRERALQSGLGWASCGKNNIYALLTNGIDTGKITVHYGDINIPSAWISESVENIEPDDFGGAAVLMTPNCKPIVFYANATNKTLMYWRSDESTIITEAPNLTLLEPSELVLEQPIITKSNYYSIEGSASNIDEFFNVTWENRSLARFGLCSDSGGSEGTWRCDVQLAYGDNEIILKSTNSISSGIERSLTITRISGGSTGDKGIAIIINGAGGIFERGSAEDRIAQAAHSISTRIIKNLTASGFSLGDIYYTGPDDLNIDNHSGTDDIVRHPAESLGKWNEAAQWAKERLSMNTDSQLYIIMIGHAEPDNFMIKPYSSHLSMRANEINTFIESITTTHPTYIFIDTCYSGSFVDNLQKEGRLIITSSQEDQVTIMNNSGIPSFSFLLWKYILQGKTLEESFILTKDKMKNDSNYREVFYSSKIQNPPQIPVMSDGKFAGEKLGWIELSENPSLSPPPKIDSSDVGMLDAAIVWMPQNQSEIIIDNVWAIITPSLYQPLPLDPLTGNSFDNQPKLDFILQGASLFTGQYKGFVKTGIYNITLYAENITGNVSEPFVFAVKNERDDLNVAAIINIPESLQDGESLNITVTANTEIDEGEYHQYHAVVLPNGQMLILSEFNTFLELSRIMPFNGKRLLVSSEPKTWELVSVPDTTGIPTGKYTWYSIFVAPGDSPFNTENWLGINSQDMYVH